VAAADSATRTDPSVDEATSPAPRRARRAAGAKAADGKTAAPRVRAAASPKAGAKTAAKAAPPAAKPRRQRCVSCHQLNVSS